jgi:hypothetical protein
MRLASLFLILLLSSPLSAGILVVHHDEWPTSNSGFSNAGSANATAYVQNLASYFTGGGTGNFLVYSSNFAYSTSFQNALTGGGHTVTVNTALPFTLANLMVFNAVFLGGNQAGFDVAQAIAYLNAGGSIYIAAGSGEGFSAATEAAFWNALLNPFGLAIASAYNGISGNLPIASAHPILASVNQLFQDNGSTVSLFGSNPNASIILTQGNAGLIGVFNDRGGGPAEIPEPSTFLLMGAGLASSALLRRAKR